MSCLLELHIYNSRKKNKNKICSAALSRGRGWGIPSASLDGGGGTPSRSGRGVPSSSPNRGYSIQSQWEYPHPVQMGGGTPIQPRWGGGISGYPLSAGWGYPTSWPDGVHPISQIRYPKLSDGWGYPMLTRWATLPHQPDRIPLIGAGWGSPLGQVLSLCPPPPHEMWADTFSTFPIPSECGR